MSAWHNPEWVQHREREYALGHGRRVSPNAMTTPHFQASTTARVASANATPLRIGLCGAFVTVRPTIVRQPLRDKHTLLTPASHSFSEGGSEAAPHAPVHGVFGLPDVASRSLDDGAKSGDHGR
jgi:hypothetical protein